MQAVFLAKYHHASCSPMRLRCGNRLARRKSTIRQIYDQGKVQTYLLEKGAHSGPDITQLARNDTMMEATDMRAKSLVNYLLPKGYPHSVRNGYSQFAIGQMVSNGLSTAAGVLSMQALLYALGIGVGAAGMGSAPLAATLNWVIKDGLGQLGGVIFASLVNNRFDADPKRWRLIATVSMDAASFLEMLTPLMPGYFLAVASVANVGKNISFLAASASRAAIHRSFTLQENLADVTAKTGSQFIVSSLLGTSLGVSLSSLVAWSVDGGAAAQYHTTLGLYGALSSVSIAVTYWSLRHVTITSLSPARLDYILHHYLYPLLYPDSGANNPANNTSAASGRRNQHTAEFWQAREIVTPETLRNREHHLGAPILHDQQQREVHLPPLHVGCDLHEVVTSAEELEVSLLYLPLAAFRCMQPSHSVC